MHRYDGSKSYEENQRVENDEGNCAAFWDVVVREGLLITPRFELDLSDMKKKPLRVWEK